MHEASSHSNSKRAAVGALVAASPEAVLPCPVCGEIVDSRFEFADCLSGLQGLLWEAVSRGGRVLFGPPRGANLGTGRRG
jgi:hypothetical protein